MCQYPKALFPLHFLHPFSFSFLFMDRAQNVKTQDCNLKNAMSVSLNAMGMSPILHHYYLLVWVAIWVALSPTTAWLYSSLLLLSLKTANSSQEGAWAFQAFFSPLTSTNKWSVAACEWREETWLVQTQVRKGLSSISKLACTANRKAPFLNSEEQLLASMRLNLSLKCLSSLSLSIGIIILLPVEAI